MKKIAVSLFIICLLTATTAFSSMSDYCQAPPFVTTSAAPNVLLLVDTSGSMASKAYDNTPYDSTKVYEGYFDPEKNYVQDANGVYVETSGSCPNTCTQWTCSKTNDGTCDPKGTHGCSSSRYACCTGQWVASDCGGNRLNYDNMARVDLLRWALTGGSPDSCDGNSLQKCDPETYPNAQLTCDADGCILKTNSGVRVKARWERITGEKGGLLFQLKQLDLQPRIGSMFFDSYGVNSYVYIGDFVASANFDGVNPYKNTIAKLNYEPPSGATPIGPAMWAAKAYLAQESYVFGSPQPQTGTGDQWKNPMYQCVDANNDGNCQGNEFVLVPCSKNFIILLTDGQWNMGGNPGSVSKACSIDVGYEQYSADPVVPAYWLHKKGYINTPTNIASYVESIYTVGLWLDGTGKQSLKQVAMFGSFDRSKTWPGNMTDYPRNTCTLDDCGDGKGSPCTPLPPSSPDWDKNGDGVPDTFFTADNAIEIKRQMMNIILDILRRASSGTAVSVLSSSEGSGANLIQALFYPRRTFGQTEISWISDLMNYWYYMDPFFTYSQIREDTVREGGNSYTLLDLKNDYIVNFVFDADQNKTIAKRWQDTDGNGMADTQMPSVPIEDARAIWRGGFDLWWTDPSARFIKTSIGSGLIPFSTSSPYLTQLQPYLGASDATIAKKIINYVRGYDCTDTNGTACECGTSGCDEIGRTRTVTTGVCSTRRSPCNTAADCPSGETCDQETHVWKLGDVINSTPRIMGPTPLNNYHVSAPVGYNDQTYYDFIASNDYKTKQRVFVGANDGMFHAFRLGKLLQDWSGKEWYQPGRLEGSTGTGGMGFESWAFIPQNVLPYLQYLQDPDYCHIYMVDGPITLADVSINKPSTCNLSNYWDCPRLTTVNSGNLDTSNTSWRTVVIGSMGIGGASSQIPVPITINGSAVGRSSYFALDVTDQDNPQLLWEFSHPELGMSNAGAAIVKVGGKDKRCSISNNTCSTDSDCGQTGGQCVYTNGKWFAVLASGPTGPITAQEFQGKSNQNLKLFILDLKTGALVRTIDTGITNAFAGSLNTSTVDLEKNDTTAAGNYQDDVVYIGYVQNTTSGGVLRLVIDDNLDPNNWKVSKVIDNIGPVTTSVVNLLDRKNGKLWLFFGEGRYFYKADDLNTQRRLFGIQEPCFSSASPNVALGCSSSINLSNLKDQTSTPGALTTEKGWYINLDAATDTSGAERMISNPTASPSGAVYFLTFAPTSDICGFGGNTYLWAVDYKSGGQVGYATQGRALIQVSTGEIKELDLSSSASFPNRNNRRSEGISGLPPQGQGMMIITNPTPIRKFMHVQER
jgi:type IV pilus assembly protein PilY1